MSVQSIICAPVGSSAPVLRINDTSAGLSFEGDCDFHIIENGRLNHLGIAEVLARLEEFPVVEQAWVLLQLSLQFKYGGMSPELWERCQAAGAVEQGDAA